MKEINYSDYYSYRESLSEENNSVLYELEIGINKELEMISEEFKSKILEMLIWRISITELLDFFRWEIPRFEREDISRRETRLSWRFWRLAITEWDDKTSPDTPYFKKEIIRFKELVFWTL